MPKVKGETDHCRDRLIKYCQGQGVDLGCGVSKIKVDAIGVDLFHPNADMKKDARVMDYFPDKHFDYVYSSHLLEEIENTEATLKEWLRILKDGGYIVLYQADKDLYYPMGTPNCNPSHKHHFGWEDLWAVFEKIGGVDLVHHAKYPQDPFSEWSFELVIRKKGGVEKLAATEPIHFKVMVVGGYAESYVDRCLSSIESQTYKNWSCQVVLDPIGDKTYENALKHQSDKIKVQLNESQKGQLENFLIASRLLQPADNDVLILGPDADDWFKSPESLSILASYYEKNPQILVSHGSWEAFPKPNVTNNGAYTPQDFKSGIRKASWRGSHLRTCKYKLWKQLNDKDLRDKNGRYFMVTADLAIMFPLLEMAGYDRVKYIPEILYTYNQETAYNDDKLRHREQIDVENYIRAKTPYQLWEKETKTADIIPGSGKPLNALIFSKDRACQLDALLRSADKHWKDWKEQTDLIVIWTCRDEYLEGYKKAILDHPDIKFIDQRGKDFKTTLLENFDQTCPCPYTMFFVDDQIFINSFSLNAATERLQDPDTLCVSLRMHPHISYCYSLNIPTPPQPITKGAWNWKSTEAKGDWAYPYSLDGHVFRTNDILPSLKNDFYSQPNALEDILCKLNSNRPLVACFDFPIVVNIPCNSVGANLTNRRGSVSEKFLNDQYLKGLKINVSPFSGMITKSCHMELDFSWI